MNPTIPKETFQFLNQLKKNNNREWFAEHKPIFKKLEEDFKKFLTQLLEELNKHDQVDKMKSFRIYRDVRFSKNKTPYKNHFSGSFSRLKPLLRGGYYLHIQPDNQSFVATGFWNPSKEDLLRIRREIELDDTKLRAIIKDKSFIKTWGEMQGEELKTAPSGFDKTHSAIDLIRKKQFFFHKNYTDKEVLSPSFLNQVNEDYKAIRPYFDFMSSILTTNLDGEILM